ncbi:MAG TPA: SpoIIE family protein phosphatase [Turneriella sp.]|nr:SpoIIE family protein phosphatase [Turneriella sp.]
MLRNMSLIGRLSLSFFAFTLVNLLLFWLATGSNQMRLIAEKSSLEMYRTLMNIETKLTQSVRENKEMQTADFYRTEKSAEVLLNTLKNSQKGNAHTLVAFTVVANDNTVYRSWPQKDAQKELSPAELQDLIKTLRLREFNNEPFYSTPNVLQYELTVYIPFLNENGRDIILRAVFSMESMRQELANLFRLGVAIVLLLLLIQAGLGFILYRFIVRPLIKLRAASEVIGRGENVQVKGYEKRGDEIGTLVKTFNQMVSDIQEQKSTIRKNLEEIQARDDMMQHELMIAKQIQKSIFPKGEYPHPIAIEYKPLLAVSGDFYDVYRFPDGSAGYLICDASGHGVPAALLTMLAKAAFSSAAEHIQDPGALMTQVNRQFAESLDLTGQYLTAFFMRVTEKEIQYCNATHPEPLLVTTTTQRLKANGFYVGMMVDTPFPFETVVIPRVPQTKLVLYTDGITEARNNEGELFGTDKLAAIIETNKDKSADAIKEIILAEVSAFTNGVAIDDDLTLMVLTL